MQISFILVLIGIILSSCDHAPYPSHSQQDAANLDSSGIISRPPQSSRSRYNNR